MKETELVCISSSSLVVTSQNGFKDTFAIISSGSRLCITAFSLRCSSYLLNDSSCYGSIIVIISSLLVRRSLVELISEEGHELSQSLVFFLSLLSLAIVWLIEV